MKDSLLYPHLLDILSDPAAEYLILAGGFGLQVKRKYIDDQVKQGQIRTLIANIPEARATTDLDFFLKLEVFVAQENTAVVRTMFETLRFHVREGREHWQFSRPILPGSNNEVIVDLLARLPENEDIRSDNIRVKSRAKKTRLHGRTTPEAFAVERQTMQISLERLGDGQDLVVSVPHPFPWICMKMVATQDWWRNRGTPDHKPGAEKHAFDVYILVAMLTESELQECTAMSRLYADHDQFAKIKAAAVEMFSATDAPGFLQSREAAKTDLEFDVFWDALQQALGLKS